VDFTDDVQAQILVDRCARKLRDASFHKVVAAHVIGDLLGSFRIRSNYD